MYMMLNISINIESPLSLPTSVLYNIDITSSSESDYESKSFLIQNVYFKQTSREPLLEISQDRRHRQFASLHEEFSFI